MSYEEEKEALIERYLLLHNEADALNTMRGYDGPAAERQREISKEFHEEVRKLREKYGLDQKRQSN